MSSHYKGKKSKSSEAYRLLHDPTRLLQLLYSKYGDIEEDYHLMYINSILYNKSSHFLILYKEYQFIYYIDEFLKRFYHFTESTDRIPKLADYYKNYHLFFCRPIFHEWALTEIMHNYGDIQAEIFYKNNYANANKEDNSSKQNKDNESSNKDPFNNYDNSLSSLDNITNNKTIFDKRTRLIIDSFRDSKAITITLDNSKITNNNNMLYSKRSKNDSFIKLVDGLMNPQPVNNNNNKGNEGINTTNTNHKNEKYKGMKIKSSLCNLTKGKIEYFNSLSGNPNAGGTKILLSPKYKPYLNSFKSNIAEFNKNKPKVNHSNNFNSIRTKNKTTYYNDGTLNNIRKISKLSSSNIHNNKNSIMIMTINGNNRFISGNINGFPTSKATKNKTYELNINSTNNHLSSNASRSKGKKRNTNTSKIKAKKFTSLKLPVHSTSNRNKANGHLHPSSSIPKYTLTRTIQFAKSKSKEKNTSILQKGNISYSNMILSLRAKKHNIHTRIQSQRMSNSNNTSNGMKTPTMQNSNANDGIFNSRNKANNQKSSLQSVRSVKHKRGNNVNIITNSRTTITNSIDDKGNGTIKKEHKREMSMRFVNQIEELIKKSTFCNQGHGSRSTNMIFGNKGGVIGKKNGSFGKVNGKGHNEGIAIGIGHTRGKSLGNNDIGVHFKNEKKFIWVSPPKF